MVGSPNFTRLVYTGDGDHVPPGSKVVEQHLIDYFRTQGLAVDLLEPGEGSDHAAFADAAADALMRFAQDPAALDRAKASG
jgi:hypothetical protein